jgi:hypothetical protein
MTRCLHLWRNRVEGACWRCHLRRLTRTDEMRRQPSNRTR